MTIFIFIFIAIMIYNILNGMASILIAKGLITSGAFFDALRNIMNILMLSFVILQVKDNYYLLIPLFPRIFHWHDDQLIYYQLYKIRRNHYFSICRWRSNILQEFLQKH